MAQLTKFTPLSNDPYLKADADMALAKFGHINTIVDAYNTADTSITTLTTNIPYEYVTTSDFTKNNDITLANVTGLSANVVAGGTYTFRAYLPISTNASGTPGAKVAVAGTATWTSVNETSYAYTASAIATVNNTTATSGTVLTNATTAFTSIIIEGTVKINAAGTLTIQFAQSSAVASDSKVLTNASFVVARVS